MRKYLFEPIQIRGLTLKNRITMPAMGTRMADEDRYVTDRLVGYHEARTKEGCGLNIVEAASIQTKSAPAHFLCISEDIYIEGHRKLTDAIHNAGGKAGLQFWQGFSELNMDSETNTLVVNDAYSGEFIVPTINPGEFQEIIASYGKAGARSVQAGYDCVEFMCSTSFDHNADEWGGRLENWAEFPLSCIREIRKNLPEEMPIFMKLTACDDSHDGGMTIEDTIAFCRMAKDAGVDVLEVCKRGDMYEIAPIDIPRGFNVDDTAKIRQGTGMLTVTAGRINTPTQAEDILAEGKADMVAMGRPILADPEFINKAMSGSDDEIICCVACNQGCFDGFLDLQNNPHITCLRNPMLGRGREFPIAQTKKMKNVLIAGGGMGGLEAAVMLKKLGHNPEIYEASQRLGGQFVTAGMAPGKGEMKEAALSFGRQAETADIPIHLGTQVNAALIGEKKPDHVIIAIGANPISPSLPGMEALPVYQAHDILEGRVQAKGKICIIGGGLVGLETADFLGENGNQITVIEMISEAGMDLGLLRKVATFQKMNELSVDIKTSASCVGCSKEGIFVKTDDEEMLIPCECVVLAVGAKARDNQELVKKCQELQIPYLIIGDAQKARRALNAVAEGFEAAFSI